MVHKDDHLYQYKRSCPQGKTSVWRWMIIFDYEIPESHDTIMSPFARTPIIGGIFDSGSFGKHHRLRSKITCCDIDHISLFISWFSSCSIGGIGCTNQFLRILVDQSHVDRSDVNMTFSPDQLSRSILEDMKICVEKKYFCT
jgi:hypothetical protein